MGKHRKIISFIKSYPLPLFVLLGIFVGIFFRFGLDQSQESRWIWYATLIIGGFPIVFRTLKGMFHGKFASDIVAMLAIITAVLLDEPFAGSIVVLMQSGGEAIEAYGLRRASFSLNELLARAPRKALLKTDSELKEIDVRQVKVGDLLVIRAGDLIPVDCTIVKGSAEIDASAITGEPLAHTKEIGDHLLSGSISVNGAIEARADKRSEESQYAKMVALVQKAQEEKAPIERLADRYAIFFTPLTLLMAGMGFLITKDLDTILSVLVVATPCPLILATPIAIICGINKAADEGIIVKGGEPIEQVASTKAVLFDKTGTITFGTPFVEEIVSFKEDPKDILYHAAIIEQLSSHSIAKAIVEKAKETSSSLPLPHQFQEIPGKGVVGEIEGHLYHIGSFPFLKNIGCQEFDTKLNEKIERYFEKNKLTVFVVKDKKCLGFIVITDHIRPSIPSTIQQLKTLGVKEILMVTGDSRKNAEIIAKLAGIEQVEAELLPEHKVEIVKKMRKKYEPTVMVGDGINDAPALATATVGIAMGASGTAISAEAASIVLLVDDPSKVASIVAIGKRMLFIAKQSIFIGMGLSFCLMVIAAFGYIQPAVGAILQEIIDVAVILNALRAR